MIPYFSRLFEYTHWADQRILSSMEERPPKVIHAMGLFAHLLMAERVWLMRIRGQDSSAEVIWPEMSLGECRSLAAENVAGYTSYLYSAADHELDRLVDYRNQTGAEYRTRVRDILTHVALHGSYHRGQIAMAMRTAGETPVNTDFITFAREGG